MGQNYYGMKTRSLRNSLVGVDYLTEAGPRIVRFYMPDLGTNVLAETPQIAWDTPYGKYFVRGGHRLWRSPEVYPFSYVPDNEPVAVEDFPGIVRLTQPAEAESGLVKSMEIRLHTDRPAVTILHKIENQGQEMVEIALWSITQLPNGGLMAMPQVTGALDEAGKLPNRNLVMWPYTSWADPRLVFNDDYIFMFGNAKWPACKVGYLNRSGWTGYLRGGYLFVKRFEPVTGQTHPDWDCNVEVYCDHQFLESETLSPLHKLEPGEAAEHLETWELYEAPAGKPTVEGLRELVAELKLNPK